MNSVKGALLKQKEVLLKLLIEKDYKNLCKKLNSICILFCLPRTKYDRTFFTPYNEGIFDTQGYVNYSVITTQSEGITYRYIAASKPRKSNVQSFKRLFRHSDIIISCIKDINYVDCPIKSVPIKLNNKIIFYDEIYEDCRILRFENWKDHDVLDVDEIKLFYKYYKNLNISNPLIHCLAGVGRTGFIIMYDILYGRKVREEEFLDILIDLRSQRNGLVYSEKQMKFLAETFIDERQ